MVVPPSGVLESNKYFSFYLLTQPLADPFTTFGPEMYDIRIHGIIQYVVQHHTQEWRTVVSIH